MLKKLERQTCAHAHFIIVLCVVLRLGIKMKFCDLHCDTVTELFCKGLPLWRNSLHVDLERLSAYENVLQVFAVWTDSKLQGAERFTRALAVIENFKKEIALNAAHIALCTDFSGVEKAWENGQVAAVLAIEGAGAFDGRLENLEVLYQAGVRIVTITWNGPNELAVGQPDEGGLTGFGRAALSRMARLGIIADVSHANRQSFDEILEAFPGAVMASHSNVFEVYAEGYAHGRNLTADQRGAIAARRGLIGMNLCPDFVWHAPVRTEHVLTHMKVVLDEGLGECLALGCDFDGVRLLPEGIGGAEDLDRLYRMLCNERDERTADAVFHGNALRFFQENLR